MADKIFKSIFKTEFYEILKLKHEQDINTSLRKIVYTCLMIILFQLAWIKRP